MIANMNRRHRFRILAAIPLLLLALVGGCSNSGMPAPPSVVAEFAVDFAREVVAAWLL